MEKKKEVPFQRVLPQMPVASNLQIKSHKMKQINERDGVVGKKELLDETWKIVQKINDRKRMKGCSTGVWTQYMDMGKVLSSLYLSHSHIYLPPLILSLSNSSSPLSFTVFLSVSALLSLCLAFSVYLPYLSHSPYCFSPILSVSVSLQLMDFLSLSLSVPLSSLFSLFGLFIPYALHSVAPYCSGTVRRICVPCVVSGINKRSSL